MDTAICYSSGSHICFKVNAIRYKHRMLLLGPPGSGKGTVGELLAKEIGLPKLSTGDILRDEIAKKTEFGRMVEAAVSRGEMAPDEIIVEKTVGVLKDAKYSKGVLLDGFPRTVNQAEILEKMKISPELAIYLDAPDEELVKRLSARMICPKCHSVYNKNTNPPKKEGVCDNEGQALIQRADDSPEVIKRRLEVYHSQTRDLVGFFKDRGILLNVDAVGPPEVILRRIIKVLPRKAGR